MAKSAAKIAGKSKLLDSPWRKDFPVLGTFAHGDKPLAFLDSAASAQKPQCVIDAMDKVLTGGYSNIHRGLYEISQDLTQGFEDVRSKVAKFIGAPSENNIIFTRNATESVNIVAQSWGREYLKAGDEILITEMEHHANIVPWHMLSEQIGVVVKVAPILTDGSLDVEAFEGLLSDKTKLVAFVEISNALGTINPVSKLVSMVRGYNSDIKILVDGAQGIVHRAVDVSAMDADFYVLSGHKIYGPSGIGALYGKYDLLESMAPYQGGGDMIEKVSFATGITYREAPFKFEAGTPAIVEVIGLGAAIDYITNIGMDKIEAYEKELLGYTARALGSIGGVNLYGAIDLEQRAGIFSFTMDCAHTSDIGMILDQCGVAVRTGHHCTMPLMEALGIDSTARASLAFYNNKDDIDALVVGIEKVQELFS